MPSESSGVNKFKIIIFAGAGIVVLLVLAWFYIGWNKNIRRDSTGSHEELRYIEYCLKNHRVLQVADGASYGYLYDLDAAGRPVECSK